MLFELFTLSQGFQAITANPAHP